MNYHAIIFDLDGTLLDTLDDLTDSLNHALRLYNLPGRSREEVRRFLGNGLRNLTEKAVPDGASAPVVELVLAALLGHYARHCMEKTCPYPGIPELLNILKAQGYKLAIVSNKKDFAVQALSKRFFGPLIDSATGERDNIRKKPAPDMIYEALHMLGNAAQHTLYIGDSEVDLDTARNAGIDCIVADWGFRDRQFLIEHGAGTIVSHPVEILEHLGIGPQFLIQLNQRGRFGEADGG